MRSPSVESSVEQCSTDHECRLSRRLCGHPCYTSAPVDIARPCKRRQPLIATHLACRPASLTALAHNSISARTMAANSAGLLPTGSTPSAVNCSAILESLVALPTSAAMRSTMVFGVPAGAIKPHHDIAVNPGKPDSAMVGTCGA